MKLETRNVNAEKIKMFFEKEEEFMAQIKSEYIKERVKKVFPNFDFSKERTYKELSDIVDLVNKAIGNKSDVQRVKDAIEMGVYPGVVLENDDGERAVVNKIYINGYVSLKGKRGGFNPRYWKVIS